MQDVTIVKATNENASNLNIEMITELSDHVRDSFNLNESNENLNDIVERLNGEIIFEDPSSWQDGQVASLKVFSEKESFQIMISKYLTKESQNYAIAHELGHLILHSDMGQKSLEFSLYGDGILEDEADAFAYNLLLPKEKIMKIYNNNNSIALSSIHFNTPSYIIKNRINNLNL